ncbi:Endoplasmin [Portunus trituberculatus]|uniref:Endoplasmin n=1 Tax=Portunus trituberculatus TaxID=210409 RepID=A0A5B7CKR1_PORTR|nr:Endoplasmin [Portunus trituberculatus]
MTRNDLVNNLGTIAKSGTSEFFSKLQDSDSPDQANDLIGQFGVGFYSAFLVADRVVVTSKNNADQQHIWESDSAEFSVVEDPRGDTLKRGTTVSLHLKEEAYDFVEVDTVKTLVKKYSQFINFPIYLWESKTEEVEEPLDEDEVEEEKEEDKVEEDEEGKVEEEKEDKPKTKKVSKTTWDWTLVNDAKPIWTRKPAEIEDEEYNEFYKTLSKDSKDPLAKTHFIAEGEVTFKSLLFVPEVQPSESFNKYGTRTDNIKLYVRRVFITDDFQVENSPFVERLLKKGYEVLFLTEAIDEYAVNAIPEFEGKKFQNVAKEGLTIDEGEGAKERLEELKKVFEPLTKWLSEDALKDEIMKAEVGERLSGSPCVLISSKFGWTGNMERIVTSQTHAKANDVQRNYYLSQKKTLEINPRHPLVKELLRRVESDPADEKAKNIAEMMFHTATLRSGYMLRNTVDFSKSVEEMMRQTLGIAVDEPVEEEPEYEEADEDEEQLLEEDEDEDGGEVEEMHDEL